MDYKPGLDVIVVNYKTPRDLRDFGDSYVKSHHDPDLPTTLWLCNVEPEFKDVDASRRVLERVEDGYDIPFQTNVGYSGAVNHAANLGNREMLAIFNADVILSPRALIDCASALSSNESWGVLGPKQTDGKRRLTHAGIFGTLREPKIRGWKESDKGQYDDVRDDGVSVAGSAYFIKREVWDELHACPLYWKAVTKLGEPPVGAFLPTPHYYEETFCSYHAITHGWKVAYYGIVEIVHKWHQASPVGGFADQKFKESRRIFRQVCSAHDIPHD